MIPLSLKYTAKVDVETPLIGYLALKYGKEEAAKHAATIRDFQSLRTEVASIQTPNEGARDLLIKYLAQTQYAKDRFPVNETAVKINFTWTDALKPKKTVSQFSWAFERASALFNLAAISSYLGANTNRSEPAGIEAAAKHFSAAAGTLTHLRDVFAPQVNGTLPYDLTAEGLNMLTQLMLAQSQVRAGKGCGGWERTRTRTHAQACYFEMARAKGMKAETCAKLAGQCADFYRTASGALSPAVWEDVDRDFPWSIYCRYWTACFDSSAFYSYSQKALADAEVRRAGGRVCVAHRASPPFHAPLCLRRRRGRGTATRSRGSRSRRTRRARPSPS